MSPGATAATAGAVPPTGAVPTGAATPTGAAALHSGAARPREATRPGGATPTGGVTPPAEAARPSAATPSGEATPSGGTGRPLRADARRNQEKLIAVAREAFTAHGVEAPLDEIARRAGVGPGTLYRHFPTRESLLAAVYRSDVEALAERAHTFATTLPPQEALSAWVREQIGYIGHVGGLGGAIKSMLSGDSETMDYCRTVMRSSVSQILEPAQRAGSIRSDIDPQTLLRLIHSVGMASESAPESTELMLSVVLSGLRP